MSNPFQPLPVPPLRNAGSLVQASKPYPFAVQNGNHQNADNKSWAQYAPTLVSRQNFLSKTDPRRAALIEYYLGLKAVTKSALSQNEIAERVMSATKEEMDAVYTQLSKREDTRLYFDQIETKYSQDPRKKAEFLDSQVSSNLTDAAMATFHHRPDDAFVVVLAKRDAEVRQERDMAALARPISASSAPPPQSHVRPISGQADKGYAASM